MDSAELTRWYARDQFRAAQQPQPLPQQGRRTAGLAGGL